jgi:glucose-1-phosphate thymidylyltransferase
MQGIILAGGTGSRLYPLTKVTNKHLLPVGRKPMILHPVSKMVEAGVKDIMIITGTEHIGAVVGLLGSGKDYDCNITYRVQDQAGGIAQALGLCEGFIRSRFCVILGDNMFKDDLALHASCFETSTDEAMVILKNVEDPERFGVATLENGRIIKIVEKPVAPDSDLAVTGIYFYTPQVFEVIKTLKPSRRNELEITDVNNYYVQNNKMGWMRMSGWWTDAGTFDSLLRANNLMEKENAEAF